VPILDDVLFPKENPDAKRLVDIMAGLYRVEREAILFAQPFGIDPRDIQPNLSPRNLWYDLLEMLARNGKLRPAIQTAREAFPDNQEVQFLDHLLALPIQMDVIPGFDPLEYVSLFDRASESDCLRQFLFPYRTPPPLNPIVIGVLAERWDEYTYFLKTISSQILTRINNTRWQDEWIKWAPTADVNAEFELRKIAANKPGGDEGEVRDVIARLRPALAGRAMWLMLRSEFLRQPAMRAKLEQFLSLWGQFGMESPPPALLLAIVRYDEKDLSLAEVEPIVTSVLEQAGNGVIAIKPVTLSTFDVSQFDEWHWVLTELGKKFDQIKFAQFKEKFTATFRLRELMERLAEDRIYS
jgi:hypothetical protein